MKYLKKFERHKNKFEHLDYKDRKVIMDDLVYYLGEVLDELDVILRLSPTPKKIRYGYTDRTFDIIYFIDLKNIMENIRDKKIDTILN